MALTVLCLGFLGLMLLGVPVAFAIGLACLATFAVEGLPFETAIQMMVSGMNVFSFLAIPFFIFSGELMLHGGIADKIVAFARALVGHWRGGLGLANVFASTLFGGVSGSPVADTSAMGGVMIPIMKREGYSAAYAVNVTTHASLTGALMPTSHNMIIYAFAAQAATGMIGGHVIKGVSIGDLSRDRRRAAIVAIPQHPAALGATVDESVSLGCPTSTTDGRRAALAAVGLDHTVQEAGGPRDEFLARDRGVGADQFLRAKPAIGEVGVDAEAGRIVFGLRVVALAGSEEGRVVGIHHVAGLWIDDGGQGFDRLEAFPERRRDVAGQDFLAIPAFLALGHVRIPEVGDVAL